MAESNPDRSATMLRWWPLDQTPCGRLRQTAAVHLARWSAPRHWTVRSGFDCPPCASLLFFCGLKQQIQLSPLKSQPERQGWTPTLAGWTGWTTISTFWDGRLKNHKKTNFETTVSKFARMHQLWDGPLNFKNMHELWDGRLKIFHATNFETVVSKFTCMQICDGRLIVRMYVGSDDPLKWWQHVNFETTVSKFTWLQNLRRPSQSWLGY